MWIRFKKRTKPFHTLYHWFDPGQMISFCRKETRRENNKYGRERSTFPVDRPVCRRCHEKYTSESKKGYRESTVRRISWDDTERMMLSPHLVSMSPSIRRRCIEAGEDSE